MKPPLAVDDDPSLDDDARRLHALGYRQELARRLSGFSNFALSLSIICVLAGGVTSFHLGYSATGGAAIGLGWPLACGFAVIVAAAMGQLASAYPTAGGLYHWAAILGGPGWGWTVAWFNLAGLVTVLAAINVGMYRFALTVWGLADHSGATASPLLEPMYQACGLVIVTGSQAAVNHLGIGLTARLTDFSGYWILLIAGALAVCLLVFAPSFEPARLITLANHAGPAGGDVWPATQSLFYLFALGLLLPAYTITGFDASAHAAEETIRADWNVPRGIVRSVVVSGVVGWILLGTVVLAAPDPPAAAGLGEGAFLAIVHGVLPRPLAITLLGGIVMAQYLCGLATVTSASRMAYAFARDGGLPASKSMSWVCPRRKTPAVAIWIVATASVLFTLSTPVYSTITAVCTIFLYLSYVLPTALGAWTHGRTWTACGPWNLGSWYRPLAAAAVLGCLVLILIGMQPPNDRAAWVVLGFALVLAIAWNGGVRRRFKGPPHIALNRLA